MTAKHLKNTARAARAALLAPLLLLAACNQAPGGADKVAAADSPPLAGAAIGGPFTLVDKHNQPHSWASFAGQWRIVYFGYTFCPDACPLDVQVMMRGFNEFSAAHADRAAKVQPIFITIDPARDTPAVVGQWTAAFGPRLLGLTGTKDQADVAAKQFAVYYARGEDSAGGYLMDHSRIAYLFDPTGKPIAMLPIDKDAKAVATELAHWVR